MKSGHPHVHALTRVALGARVPLVADAFQGLGALSELTPRELDALLAGDPLVADVALAHVGIHALAFGATGPRADWCGAQLFGVGPSTQADDAIVRIADVAMIFLRK